MKAHTLRRALIGAAAVVVLATACSPTRPLTGVEDLVPRPGPVSTTSTVTSTTTVPEPEWFLLETVCVDPAGNECEVLIFEEDLRPHFMKDPMRPPALHHFRDPQPPVPEEPHEASTD